MPDHEPERDVRGKIERPFAEMRRRVNIEVVVRKMGQGREDLEAIVRRNSRRRPPGMAPALVEPPRGPLPLAGGAEAPLEFREG